MSDRRDFLKKLGLGAATAATLAAGVKTEAKKQEAKWAKIKGKSGRVYVHTEDAHDADELAEKVAAILAKTGGE